jgi:hypothetical protein
VQQLRSSHELLVWLAEVSASVWRADLRHGEHLLGLAIREGKVPPPPNALGDWLYELRDSGLVGFDDSDAASAHIPGRRVSADQVYQLRWVALTEAGRARVKSDIA